MAIGVYSGFTLPKCVVCGKMANTRINGRDLCPDCYNKQNIEVPI
jgi:NMD protein affecting ribosome stability and mRNA decay